MVATVRYARIARYCTPRHAMEEVPPSMPRRWRTLMSIVPLGEPTPLTPPREAEGSDAEPPSDPQADTAVRLAPGSPGAGGRLSSSPLQACPLWHWQQRSTWKARSTQPRRRPTRGLPPRRPRLPRVRPRLPRVVAPPPIRPPRLSHRLESQRPRAMFLAGIWSTARISPAIPCQPTGVLTRGNRAGILTGTGIRPTSASATENCICGRHPTMIRIGRIQLRPVGSVSTEILMPTACTWSA